MKKRLAVGAVRLAVAAVVLSASGVAAAQGGAPMGGASGDGAAEGAVWDLSRPLWIFFAQERLLAPETPTGEDKELRPSRSASKAMYPVIILVSDAG